MVRSVDVLTAPLLTTLAFVCVYARDPPRNAVSSNSAPPPGFSETLSIYGEPESRRAPLKTLATSFEILLELSTTSERDAFTVSTTDYTTCHTLNPAVRARKSRFRAAFSSTGSRDAQAGVKNMMFAFPDNTIQPDISLKIFRTAPPAVKSGRVASASVNPYGSCYEAAGSRDSVVVNIREWLAMNEKKRLDWLKPSWWARFYYRLRATDSFLVLPPPIKGRMSLDAQRAPSELAPGLPPAGRLTGFQVQRNSERNRQREQSYEAARELGIDFA
ncbi:hypothetical protein TWF281_001584 [Arthrobotrys megalospora]